jgi:hypothetical protein
MSLEDLGNIGELVAAVAVVVSLIYLAVQIRQNTRWLRASLADVHFRGVADWLSNVAANRDLGKTYFAGNQRFEELSEDDQRQFLFLILSQFKTYERLHYQLCQGNVDGELWNRETAPLRLFIHSSAFDAWWTARRDWFHEDFQREIERLHDGEAETPSERLRKAMATNSDTAQGAIQPTAHNPGGR